MCFGGSKQPEPPIKTPSYSADQIDQNIDVEHEEETSQVQRQNPYQFEEEDEL